VQTQSEKDVLVSEIEKLRSKLDEYETQLDSQKESYKQLEKQLKQQQKLENQLYSINTSTIHDISDIGYGYDREKEGMSYVHYDRAWTRQQLLKGKKANIYTCCHIIIIMRDN
jgi:chromosome segregation ATPase